MSTQLAEKNGQEEAVNSVEFEFDLDELGRALGVPEMLAQLAAYEKLLSELLTYVNFVDLSLQELQGEPVVTESMQFHVGKRGRVQAQRLRPPAPPNLTKEKLELAAPRSEG